MKKIFKHVLLFSSLLLMTTSCEALLDEKVESEYTEETLLSSKLGLESLLADAYCARVDINTAVKRSDMTTDILTQIGGGENGTAVPLINFRWDPSSSLEAFMWMRYWQMIRNANIVLENIESATGFNSEKERTYLKGEARFMRMWGYYYLWDQFGPMPIRRSSEDPLELPRASEEEFGEFMESELIDIINEIYPSGSEPAFGRVHKTAAMGLLCTWYLNNRQWQKCLNIAQDIIDGKGGKKYSLFPDYNMMFALENEQNCEFIWSHTCLANTGSSNLLCATALPPGFKEGIDGYLKGVVNEHWSNFASNFKLYDEFYYSFEEQDLRKGRIVTKYKNQKGEIIDLLGPDHKNDTRSLKFPPDPEANGNLHGNDFPMFRYAEVLLIKAEALLEIKGLNQETVDLINQIRNRAGLQNISLEDFKTKEELLNHLLDERKWEFFYEAKRRRDLLRHDKYIKCAKDRGIENASDKHKVFPIPQGAIDANPLLKQNQGY